MASLAVCWLAAISAAQTPVRSVLGVSIDHVEKAYRLVDTGGDVLCRGTLEECERQLVTLLEKRHGSGTLNLVAKTAGGFQLWGDEYVFAGWRVQENVFTGHCRLLDPDNKRHAWGSYAACRTAFEKIRVDQKLGVSGKHLVVLVHGLGRSRAGMRHFAEALDGHGYEVASFGYPSTRASVADHAARLARVLDRYDGVTGVSFVAYSMGGLVVRELLGRQDDWQERLPPERLVMVATPNHGSLLAQELDGVAARLVMGPLIDDLEPKGVANLPVPKIPFAVIAGGNGGEGLSRGLEGDDDGTVRVEGTKLPGMAAFLRVEGSHRALKSHPDVVRAAVSFIETGAFPSR